MEDDETQRVVVAPRLRAAEAAVVAGLAGAPPGPRRLWPGQPGHRSPWLPCPDGCCLGLDPRPSPALPQDPAVWLRFLIREVLAPRSQAAVQRAGEVGLSRQHRLHGRVLVDAEGSRPRLVVVAGNRVREVLLDDELFPLERPPPRRGRADVLPLSSPSGRPPRCAPRWPPS